MRLLALTLSLTLAAQAHARTGGPDAFGYTFIDSNEPGGPAFYFDDISGTGTISSVTDSDDSQQQVPVYGFTFPFYGVDHTTFTIQTNGTVNFTNTYITLGNTCPLPGAPGDNVFIAAFWDDLNPGSGGDLYYQLKGTPGIDHRLIFQWEGVYRYGTTSPITMQVVLHEDGVIQVAYESVLADPSGASVGIQDGFYALEYACDAVGGVSSNLLIEYYPPALDGDGDGYETGIGGDCDDNDPSIHPGAIEACDGIDQACDGIADELDADGDGYRGCDGDCDDGDAAVNPGEYERPGDGIDNDCNGAIDDTGTGTGGGTGSGTGGGTGSGTGGGAGTGGATGTGTGAATVPEYSKLGCGCASGGAPAGGLAGLVLIGLASRRRR